jgi:threonyl-tRNA synthetase
MADTIHVKLPDGSVKDVPKGTTALDIAKSIGQRLADKALVAKIQDYGFESVEAG